MHFHRAGYLLAAIFSMLILGIDVAATVFDVLTIDYFDDKYPSCDTEGSPCYCEDSEHDYYRQYRSIGQLHCDNLFVRNIHCLQANALLTILCALVSLWCALLFISVFIYEMYVHFYCAQSVAEAIPVNDA